MDPQFLRDAFRALTWIGIIEQLQRNRAERLLRPLNISFAEFSMLNHFSHGRPPEKTVTSIAADMQLLQPAVTKTVARLIAHGRLKSAPSATDRRSRLLTLTPKGRADLDRALALLAPVIATAFEGWSRADLDRMFQGLDRLKRVLDAGR